MASEEERRLMGGEEKRVVGEKERERWRDRNRDGMLGEIGERKECLSLTLKR